MSHSRSLFLTLITSLIIRNRQSVVRIQFRKKNGQFGWATLTMGTVLQTLKNGFMLANCESRGTKFSFSPDRIIRVIVK